MCIRDRILIVIAIIFSFIAPNFLTENNLLNIVRQASINIVLATGMTVVILTGGIDLSVGSVLAAVSYTHLDVYKRQIMTEQTVTPEKTSDKKAWANVIQTAGILPILIVIAIIFSFIARCV